MTCQASFHTIPVKARLLGQPGVRRVFTEMLANFLGCVRSLRLTAGFLLLSEGSDSTALEAAGPIQGLRLIKAFTDDRPENIQRARRLSLFLALSLLAGHIPQLESPTTSSRASARCILDSFSGEGCGISPQAACCSLVSHKCGNVMAASLSTSRAPACVMSHNLDWA